VDDALGVGCGRLPRASGADPGAALVAGERVADAIRTTVTAREQGEPLEGEGGAGAVAQEVFGAPELSRHVAIREGDADAQKPAPPPGPRRHGDRDRARPPQRRREVRGFQDGCC